MAQIIGIKRGYHDTFGMDRERYDSFGNEEYYPVEPAIKKLKQDEKKSFYITVNSSVSYFDHKQVGEFRIVEKIQKDADCESILRRTQALEITDFAFHNPVSSHQSIKILESSQEVIARFDVVPQYDANGKEFNENHPYWLLHEQLDRQNCVALCAAGDDHLVLLYAAPDNQRKLSAILLRKFFFVIDLDDTLVRSRIPKEPFDEPMQDEQVFQVGPHRVYTKVLENVYPFLKWADKLFKVVFVTNSIFLYASNIVRILDPHRVNILSRVRSFDCEGLSGILKHRADLICMLSEVSSVNNDIGVTKEEKQKEEKVDEDVDDDAEEPNNDKENKRKTKPSNIVETRNRRKGLLPKKKNMNMPPPQGVLSKQKSNSNNSTYIPPPPPSIDNNTQPKLEVPNNQPTQPPRDSPRSRRPKCIFIKDLENLGLPVHRSIVIDDQKHVWVRNQYNCLPFPKVNDGKGLRMHQLKTETFRKIMELQLRRAYSIHGRGLEVFGTKLKLHSQK